MYMTLFYVDKGYIRLSKKQLSSGDFFTLVNMKIELCMYLLNLLKGGGGKKMGLNMRLSTLRCIQRLSKDF